MKENPVSPPETELMAAAEVPVTPAEKTTIDRTRSATVQIFEHLLQDIVTLQLKPGESISIPTLSRRFGTSRSPVREALIRLVNAGLVETFPQSGTRVSPIRMEEVREVCFVRQAIEVALVEALASQGDASHCRMLMRIIDQQQKYQGTNTVREFYGFDEMFHQKIAELADYPNVWRLMQNHQYQMNRLRYLVVPIPSRSTQIIDEHTAIVEGIATKEPDKARVAMLHHLKQVFVMQKVLQKKYPTYFDA